MKPPRPAANPAVIESQRGRPESGGERWRDCQHGRGARRDLYGERLQPLSVDVYDEACKGQPRPSGVRADILRPTARGRGIRWMHWEGFSSMSSAVATGTTGRG